MVKKQNDAADKILKVDKEMFLPTGNVFEIPKRKGRKNGYQRQMSKIRKDFMRGII